MENNLNDKNALMFYSLVQDFHMRGMVYLGKLKNPMTDKIEKNLEAVQVIIDMLAMLKEKTKGNLKDDENRYMDQALMDLRLNYVDEAAKEKEAPKEETKELSDEKKEDPSNDSVNKDYNPE